jgi:nucleoredoxin
VAGLEALLGAALVTQAGQEVATAEALAGAEHVLLYCSAHWCPPCRAFTPELTAWVNKHGARLRLKLVFASSDRDEAAFSGYFKSMAAGALALPFGDDKADELMRKFKVSGIPTLLVLDASGHLLTKQGREGVSSDAEGAHFPWAGAGAAGADESGGGGGCTVA